MAKAKRAKRNVKATETDCIFEAGKLINSEMRRLYPGIKFTVSVQIPMIYDMTDIPRDRCFPIVTVTAPRAAGDALPVPPHPDYAAAEQGGSA